MIAYREAENIILDYLNNILNPRLELTIYREDVIEFSEGFLFYYNTKNYIEDGEKGYRLSGAYPVILDKKTGEIFHHNGDMKTAALIELFKKEKGYPI